MGSAFGADHRLLPDEKDPLFAPSDDKVYRHASFYELPDEVGHM